MPICTALGTDSMKPTYIVIGIAVVAVVIAAVALASAPDIDAIIADKDCGRAMALGDHNLVGLSNKQTAQIISLVAECTLKGMLGGSP